ncbi:MAG: WHG domain-containing protein, partial [Solirubrobacterales bacterium]
FKGGKSDLYLALAERAAVANGEMLEPAFETSDDPFEQLSAVGRAYARFHLENPLALRLLSLHDVDRKGDERVQAARTRIKASLFEMLGRLEALVGEAVEAGGNDRDSARAITVFLFASWNGVLSMHARGELGAKNLKGVLRTGERLVLGAIRSGNAADLELERN